MKMFVWERLERVSSSYHSEGGLVVVAEDISAAIEIIRSKVDSPMNSWGDGVDCDAKTKDPDKVFDVSSSEDYFCVFPDAGCC